MRAERLAEEIDALIVQAHHLQIGDEELLALLQARLGAFRERQTIHEQTARS